MINNRVVKSCFLRCFQSPSSERQVLALPMPRRGKGAWLGGCQEFSIEQHLLFLTIFLQLCSGQLDSPPHLKRNHPARETSASPIIKEVPNFKRACKRQNKFLASNVDQTAFPIVLDHHCNKDQIKRRMAHHYLSLSPGGQSIAWPGCQGKIGRSISPSTLGWCTTDNRR